MKPQNRKYILNRSSMDTETDKKNLNIHVLDPETAAITQTYCIPFEMESTQYHYRQKIGFLEVFRITRFKPLLFQVDRVVSSFIDTEVVYSYDIIDKEKQGDLFDTIDFQALFFKATKTKVIFDGEIKNLMETGELILTCKPTTEKTFLKAFSVFLMAGSGELFARNLAENEAFFNKLKSFQE